MATVNGKRYDFRTQTALNALIERARAEITEEQRITIQSACRNHRFCNRVQFTPFCKEDQHVMTMGQLSDLGVNDPGIQRIDLRPHLDPDIPRTLNKNHRALGSQRPPTGIEVGRGNWRQMMLSSS